MVSSVIVGSDNNFILKHTSPNIDVVTWHTNGLPSHTTTHNAFSSSMMPQPAAFNNPQKIITLPEYGTVWGLFYSIDGGDTWVHGVVDTEVNTEPATFQGSTNKLAGRVPAAKDGNDNINIDENGIAYFIDSTIAAPFHTHLMRSPDASGTGLWIDCFDLTTAIGVPAGATAHSIYISGGWLWWLDGANSRLQRCDLTGSNTASFPITFPVGAGTTVKASYSLYGWPKTNRLIGWYWGNQVAGVVPPILSIDITNPNAPTYTFTANSPFGLHQVTIDFQPINNQTVVGVALDDTTDASGAIWQSTDGGATWSNVVANTPNLGNTNFNNEISAVAANPTSPLDVWVAQLPPYLYHSMDGGATWTIETVDMSVFDPYISGTEIRPSQWGGLAAVGIKKHTVPVSTVVGAT